MLKKASFMPATLAVVLALLSGCSLTPEPAEPMTATQTANNVPCYDCPPGGGGGDDGGGYQPTCIAPTQEIIDQLKRQVGITIRGRGWTNVEIIVALEGCDSVYPFSVNYTKNGVSTWTSGTYDAAGGYVSLPAQ